MASGQDQGQGLTSLPDFSFKHRLRIRDFCLKFVKIREFYEIFKIRKN